MRRTQQGCGTAWVLDPGGGGLLLRYILIWKQVLPRWWAWKSTSHLEEARRCYWYSLASLCLAPQTPWGGTYTSVLSSHGTESQRSGYS